MVASKITSEEAVRWGALIVNGSVACTMFGLPVLIYFLAVAVGFDTPAATIGAVLSFLASWPLAWLTWSLLVPPWRVWAYERVEDLRELKARGVQAGLIWREGHVFERTERPTSRQRQRILELEEMWAAKQRTEQANEPSAPVR